MGKYVKKNFQEIFPNSILSAKVGFMSPEPNAIQNPTYHQVCSGITGHIEVCDIELKHPEKHFEELVRFFFQFHDPTTKNRQGNDAGTQYASYIFCSDEEQMIIAKRVISELQSAINHKLVTSYNNNKVTTCVAKRNAFYEAHEEHQEYLMKNPYGYCNHRMRFKTWPDHTSSKASLKIDDKISLMSKVKSLSRKFLPSN